MTGDFLIDWEAHQARCPQGQTSTQWCEHQRAGTPLIAIKFAPKACRACPVREQCTKAKGRGRTITVYPRQKHESLQAARQRQTTQEFQGLYAQRAGVEGVHAQGIRVADLRHAHYCGTKKVHLQHLATAAALDLIRMDAWLQGIPLARTRISPLARLKQVA
jgi:transposase